MAYNYNRQNRYYYYLNFSYRKNFDYPSINQLYTITDNIDVYNVRIGNPGLKNNINHTYNFSGNFSSQKPNTKYAYNGGINMDYVKVVNPVIDSLINDASGKRFYYYTNARQNQNYNINYNLNVTRHFGKNNIQLSYEGSYNKNTSPVYIDNVFSETDATTQNHNVNLQLDLHTKFIFSIGKTFNTNRSIQSAAGLNSFKNFSDISRFGLTVNYPQHYTFSSTIDYTKNTNIKKPILLWNAFASHRFLKSQQMELKFSAMDILKQFRNIENFADNYGTTTTITNGLQQFFLLTVAYYPRKFGKTTIKQQDARQDW